MQKTRVKLCWMVLVGCALAQAPNLIAQTSGGLVSSYRVSPTPMRPSRAYVLTVETAPAVNQVTALVDFRPYTSLRTRLVLTYDPKAGAWRANGKAPGGFPVPPGAEVLVSAYASTVTGLRQTVAWRHLLALNAAPTAAAGPDFSAARGASVVLDGSGSSDSDGDPLTYEWSFLSRPAGSGASLSDATAVKPNFALDVSGTYTLILRVNDGLAQSAPDTVEISTLNSTPAANAGPDQSAPAGATVVLDGSQSSDADGDQLNYAWSILNQPAASTAQLSDPTAVKPSLPLDAPGSYVLQLLVSDGFTTSGPDTLTISTHNSPPVANAGPDQAARVGETVTLDASLSSDVDGDQLTRQWSFLNRPAGSTAALSDPVALKPVFLLDVAGTYVVQLIVNDGQEASPPDTITLSTLNSRPVANAGPDQTARLGQSVQLDGAASTDADRDPLEYAWSFSARPIDSATDLSDPALANPMFQVDRPGQYVLQLLVSDGQESSGPDTVTISTANSKPVAHAGPDQSVTVGIPVMLDGTASTDADGDSLFFFWAFTARPDDSATQLTDPALPGPGFNPDRAGDYVVQLIVGDGQENGDPDTLTVTATELLVTVPDLVGQLQAQAETALQAVALGVSSSQALSDVVAAGQVISQNPAAGTQVSPGTVVALLVSLGAAPTTLTLTPEAAQVSIGRSLELNVTLDRPAPAGGVVVQLSADNALVSFPSSIAVQAGQTMQTFSVTAGALAGTANVTASAPSLTPDSARVTVVDNVPPAIALALEPASDTPPVSDDTTEINPIILTGQTEARLAVVLKQGDADGVTLATTTADSTGRFSFVGITLVPGPNPLTAMAEDASGNFGTASRTVVLELCPLASLSDWTINITPPTPLVTSPLPGSVTAADCGVALTEGDSFLVSLERAFTLSDSALRRNALRLTLENANPVFDGATPNAIRDAFELAVVGADGHPLTYTVGGGGASADACLNLTDGQPAGLAAGVTVTPSTTQPGRSEVVVNLAHLFPGQSFKVILRLVNNDRDRLTTVRVADLRLAFVDGLGTVLAPPSSPPPANLLTPGLTLPGSTLGNISFDPPAAPAGSSTPPGGNAAPEDPLGPALSIATPLDGTSLPAGSAVLLNGSATARALLNALEDPGVFVRYDGFSQPEGLTLNGQAQTTSTPDGGVLRLTPAVGGASGSAFSSARVNAASFSSFFAFRITEPRRELPGGPTRSLARGVRRHPRSHHRRSHRCAELPRPSNFGRVASNCIRGSERGGR